MAGSVFETKRYILHNLSSEAPITFFFVAFVSSFSFRIWTVAHLFVLHYTMSVLLVPSFVSQVKWFCYQTVSLIVFMRGINGEVSSKDCLPFSSLLW